MSRFVSETSGSGIPSIRDTRTGKLICGFFIDKETPERTTAMLMVCVDALNAAVEQRAEGEKSGERPRRE